MTSRQPEATCTGTPGLLVADLPAFADRLASHDVPVEWDDLFPGFRRCYVNDPHGNRLELMESVPVGSPSS